MGTIPPPTTDVERLRRYHRLVGRPDPAFSEIVRLAATLCGALGAEITLEDGTQAWAVAAVRLPGGAHAEPCDDPTPLVTADGDRIGSLQIFDRAPRPLSDDQRATLRHLARSAILELELRRSATEQRVSQTIDPLLALAVEATGIGLCEIDTLHNLVLVKRPNKVASQSNRTHTYTAPFDAMVERVHPDDRRSFVDAVAHAQTHPAETADLEFRLQDAGTTSFYRIMLRGAAPHVLGCFQDISPTKILQADHDRDRETLHLLSRRLLRAHEEERRHVARELHDDVGQTLTGLKLDLRRLRRFTSDPAGIALIARSSDDITRTIDAIRTLSLDLRPPQLDALGLEAALRWHVERIADAAALQIDFVSDLQAERFLPEIEIAGFRIAQEALTNVVRHAAARHVTVELQRRPDQLTVMVDDDGQGFDPLAATERHGLGSAVGLAGMSERAALAGGRLDIWSKPGAGATIRAWLPLPTA